MFENRMLIRIYGSKREEVTGECIMLHNEKFCNLCSAPNIIRVIKSKRMRWANHVAYTRKMWHVQKILVGKSKGKRPCGRSRHSWKDNIKIDLK
jgi:hypothetical protein